MEQIIEKRIVVHAKAETVYRALTEGRALARWFANRAESKPVPGGSLLLMWGTGEQTEGARAVFSRLVPGREVALQWVSKIKPGETIAVNGLHESTFTISPSPEGVIVAMRYTADPPPADSERMKMDQDWDQALVSLKSLCEGPDAPLGDEARAAMERRASAAAGAGAEPIEAVHVVATPRRAAARPKAGGKKKPAKTAKTARKSTKKRAKVAKKAKTKAKAKGKKAARRPAKRSAARPARKPAKKKAGSAKRARSSARKPARKKPAKKR